MFAIFFSLCSCSPEPEEIPPTADLLLNRVSQHLRKFTEAEPNSLEYFEAIFQIRFAIDDYRNRYHDNESEKVSDLLHAELSASNLNALYDAFERIYLWERLPTAAELELMVERGAIATPPEYQMVRSQPLRSTIHSADRIFVYEGYLRAWDVRDFDYESLSYEGQAFILPKHQIKADGIIQVSDLLGTEHFLKDFRGDKACGGFSADYMVEWDFEGSPVRVMICNGCHEIIITYRDLWFKHDFAEGKATEIKQRMAQFDRRRTEMREAIDPEKKGLSEEEKAEIRAAMKGEK